MRLGTALAIVMLVLGGAVAVLRPWRVDRPDRPREAVPRTEVEAEADAPGTAKDAVPGPPPYAATHPPPVVRTCLRGGVPGLPGHLAPRGWVAACGPAGEIVRARLDGESRFTMWNLPAESPVDLRLGFGGGPADHVLLDGLALDDGERREVVLPLEGSFLLVGRVTDREGGAIRGAKVTVVPAGIDWSDPRTRIRSRSDRDGWYAVVESASAEPRLLKMVVDGIEDGYILEERAFRAPASGLLTVDVALERGLPIAGRVVDAKDRPVIGADVYVSEHYRDPEVEHRLEVRGHVKTDASGRFRDDAYRPGRYRILVQGDCDGHPFLAVEEEVVAGREDLVIRFAGFGSLALRFEDGDTGRPLPVMNGAVQRVYARDGEEEEYVEWATFGNEKEVDLARLPAGDYRVCLNHRGYRPVLGDVIRVEPGRKLGPMVYALKPAPARER